MVVVTCILVVVNEKACRGRDPYATHVVVTSSGTRRSISRANAKAARRTVADPSVG